MGFPIYSVGPVCVRWVGVSVNSVGVFIPEMVRLYPLLEGFHYLGRRFSPEMVGYVSPG